MPPAYAWVIYFYGGKQPRQIIMASLVTVWGIRLTYNFARKGGYSWKFWEGEEDYRWVHVRKIPFVGSKLGWFLFNLIFISYYQAYLIMGFTLPMILTVSSGGQGAAIGPLDSVAIIGMVIFIVFETMADEQQQAFQNEKYRIINAKEIIHEPYKTGFLTTGLFAYSRHPNYACE
jgi:steroid 5-alpha reductase family enzyme